jgi:ferritin-like metal-binding protein YciE
MSTQRARDLFVTGLRNAHAMERQGEQLMERQSERLAGFPEVQDKIRDHLQQTRQQLRRLEGCLEACGESPSTVKDMVMSFMGNLAAMGHAMAGDEVLKHTLANYAFEHYEIAAYKSLLALAAPAGISESITPLRASLQEEEEMAKWIEDHVQDVTLAHLTKAERAHATANERWP